MAAMNLRLARPSRVIDLRKVPAMGNIEVGPDTVRIGAMATHASIIASDRLREAIPLLAMAGRHIAHSTIREHGTMGGSLALADPASEWPTVVTLLGGRLRAVNVRGDRWIDIRDFFHSFYTTELATDEILAEIDIPLPKRGVRFAFQEFSRQRGAFAIAMAAVSFTPGDGSPGKLDAVLGGCGPRPVRLELGTLQADASLDQHVAEILDRASLTPTNDVHASAEDRRTIASSLLVGCVTELLHPTSQRGH